MTKIAFPYGKQTINFNLSQLSRYQVFSPGNFEAEKTEEEIMRKSLDDPVGSPSLSSLLSRKKPSKITVVMSDVTRVTGSHIFLPLLARIFQEQGVPPQKVTYLIAAGIHPPCSRKQVEVLLGVHRHSIYRIEEVKSPYKFRLSNGSWVIQHNAKEEANLATAGRFSDGTTLKISKPALESDFLILTGAITLHYLAGFGGGRKAILPGISSYDNCMDLHKLSLCKKRHCKNKRVSLGNLQENPFHQRMEEAVEMVRPAFLINSVCNDEKRIIHAVSGHWAKAFQKGVRFLRKNISRKSDTLFDAAIVSCGGFPKDINFIQSHKSLENAISLVKDKGTLLLVAECGEKIGHPTFLNWFRFNSEREFVQSLKNEFEINGQTALAVFNKCGKIRIQMLTGLGEAMLNKMNIQKVSGIEDFVKKENLAKKNVALIPNGSVTWARYHP